MKQLHEKIEVREIRPSDAEEWMNLVSQIDSESDFMLCLDGERKIPLNTYTRYLTQTYPNSGAIILVAVHPDGFLLGYIFGNRPEHKKGLHKLNLAMGIRESFTMKGVGTLLMNQLIVEARRRGIMRLEAGIMHTNKRSLNLVARTGFAVEGVRKSAYVVNGTYYDEIMIGMLLEETSHA